MIKYLLYQVFPYLINQMNLKFVKLNFFLKYQNVTIYIKQDLLCMVNSLLMMKKNIYSFINNLIILLNAKNAQY